MKNLISIKPVNLITGLLVGLGFAPAVLAAHLNVPANYPTIQAAVDVAAPGDTIRIRAGVYLEQVLIARKNLTIVGEAGAILKAKPGLVETLLPYDATALNIRAVLGIVFSDNVVVTGLTIDGAHLGEVNSVMFGVLFHGSGGRLENCIVKGFRGDSTLEPGQGFAAGNFEYLGRPIQQLRVSHNVFSDNSISVEMTAFDSDTLRLSFVIQDNIITGIGPTDIGTQDGIRIAPGAGGEVKRNEISEHNSVAPAYTFSSGINATDQSGNQIPLQPVLFEGNTFHNNQEHIIARSADYSKFVNNTFEGSSAGTRPNGIAASGNNLEIINNDFQNMPTGITLFGDDPDFGTALGIATNVRLIANRFCHVTTPFDIEPLVTGVTEHSTKIGCGGLAQ